LYNTTLENTEGVTAKFPLFVVFLLIFIVKKMWWQNNFLFIQ